MEILKAELENAIKNENRFTRMRVLSHIFHKMVISASNQEEINNKGQLIEKVFHETCGNTNKPYTRMFQIIFNSLLVGTNYHIDDEHVLLCQDKHGYRYLSLSDLEKFRTLILKIIEQRFDDGFYNNVDEQYDSVLIDLKEYPEVSMLLDNNVFVDFVKKNNTIYSSYDDKKKCFGMINFLITKNEYHENITYINQIADAIKYLGNHYNGYYFWNELLKKLKSHHVDEDYSFFKKQFGDVYCNLVKLSEMPLSLTLKKQYESECQERYSALYQIVYHIIREKDDEYGYGNCSLITLE
jgi:hypothetical protein